MIANFFKKTSATTNMFLVVIYALIYCASILKNINSFSWYSVTLVPFFIFIVLLINRNNLLTFDNSFCFLFLIILIGLFPELLNFNKILVINILLLFVFRKIYSLQFLDRINSKVFDAGFWIGIVFILEPLGLFFLIILFLAIIMHGRSKLNIFILPLISVSAPSFLFYTYCFFVGKEDFFYSMLHFEINFSTLSFNSPAVLYNLIFVGFFVLFSIISKSLKVFGKINTFKISWILVLFHFSFSVILFFSSNDEVHSLFYLLFPTAIILSNGVELYKDLVISDIALILLIINMFVPYFV